MNTETFHISVYNNGGSRAKKKRGALTAFGLLEVRGCNEENGSRKSVARKNGAQGGHETQLDESQRSQKISATLEITTSDEI